MTSRLGLGVLIAPATATWVPGFAAYYMFLQHRVIRRRMATHTSLGDSSTGKRDNHDPLYVAIRSQENFLENVPLALLFGLLAELNGADRRIVNYMLGLLLAVRVAHVEIGMKTGGMGRAIGFFGSQGVMAGFAGYIVVLLKDYWGFG